MVLITKENKTYNYPINLQPSGEEFTLEVYSHMSKTTTTFTGLTGVVVDDFVGIEMTDVMLSKLPNGEYDYTVYDNDQTRVSIGLLRVDLEQQGTEDDPEYVIYEDEMDGGYITTQNQEEAYEQGYKDGEKVSYESGFTDGYESGYTDCYPIAYDEGYDVGFEDGVDSVPLVATGFTSNGVFLAEEGGWNEVSINVQVNDCCYFKSLENNNQLGMDINDPSLHIDMEYSINNGEWVNWDFTDITLQSGDTVYLRGNNPSGTCSEENYDYKAKFTTSGMFDLGGNFVSLFDKTVTATACPNYEYCFNRLFQNCNIVHINKYFLSQLTTLTPYCYSGMFLGCIFMENTPELPVTTLAEGCYDHMFAACKKITTIPDLPATTLTKKCYCYMFQSCHCLVDLSNITLPATTLAVRCYETMFGDCRNLQKAPYLPATTLVSECYRQMFLDCGSINYIRCNAITKTNNSTIYWLRYYPANGTFVKNINATGWTVESGETIGGIPSGWTILNDYTELQSTAITENGTYVPQSGAAFDNVVVNVPSITPTGETTITENGTYDITQYARANVIVPTGITPTGELAISGNGVYDVTQFANANVNVPVQDYWQSGYTSGFTNGYESGVSDGFESGYSSGRTDGYNDGYSSGYTDGVDSVPLNSTGFTANGTYSASTGGWSAVTVNVPTGITPTGQFAISGNGTYDITQYASVDVNVPLSTTGITSNGTYTKESGGWNEVTVNVPSVTTQTMTQAQYDALTIKDPMVIYLING